MAIFRYSFKTEKDQYAQGLSVVEELVKATHQLMSPQ